MKYLNYNIDWSRVSTNNGYRLIYCPDHPRSWKSGYVYEHRLILEKKLGRFLTDIEVVHHIDHNKLNNSPSNLQLKENAASHIKEHKRPKIFLSFLCNNCGKSFMRRKGNDQITKNSKRTFCSRTCNGQFYGFKNPRKSKASHGERAKYLQGCRCLQCKKANAVDAKIRRIAKSGKALTI